MTIQNSRKPAKIIPAEVLYVDNRSWSVGSINSWSQFILQLFRAFFLAVMFSGIASFVGFVILRLFQSDGQFDSLKQAMDHIFRSQLPSLDQIMAVLVISLIFAIVFYSRFLLPDKQQSSPSTITRFFAGLFVAMILDILLFKFSLHQILYDTQSFLDFAYASLIAQAGACLTIVLLTPAYSALGRVRVFPSIRLPTFPQWLRSMIAWARIILVSLVLIWCSILISTLDISGVESQNISRYVPFLSGLNLSIGAAGSLLIAMAIASLFFWAAPARNVRRLWLSRIITLVACIALIFLIYTFLPVGEIYIETLGFAGGLTLLSAPLFRVLS